MACYHYQSCYNSVDIRGMGAVCCENGNPDGQTCYNTADFTLADRSTREAADTVCSGDMCCIGYQTCNTGKATNVGSLTCKGYQACYQYDFSLDGDLICDADAPTECPGDSNHGVTCASSSTYFRFQPTGDGTHCVQCKGQTSCKDANFEFPENASAYFFCADGEGGDACEAMVIKLAAGSCMEINLTDGSGEGKITVDRSGSGNNEAW
ncbi:ATG18A [Symbiodinium necroappetens]|uniref:ATG18A protein n=1 Tax=Symbiodinium necroappetens TaxID=1628268 RepID=A0A812VYK6_9DINO|nr:ATG18A [Symbiodinium necroappetens]